MKAHLVDLATREDIQQISTAKDIAETLLKHYPGHLWAVGWQGGSIAVKNMNISGDYGFYIHPEASATSSELADKAVRFGGELLERAGIKRGKWNGVTPTALDIG